MAWTENRFDEQLEELQESIGYRFSDRDLLVRAVTHRSFANELDRTVEDNERLEFLGDAVLELSVSRQLFARFETMSEGQLTRARAAIVRSDSLAQASQTLQLGTILRLGRGEEQTGGRTKESVLADGFEALLGALYLDGGFDEAERLVVDLLGDHLDSPKRLVALDPKSQLQEVTQRRQSGTPHYELVEQTGPAHATTFIVQVCLGETVLARGEGPSKKSAESAAAKRALETLTS